MSRYTYTDEDLRNAVKACFSIRQVLLLLNIIPAGGNYATIKRKIKDLELDTSHFLGHGHLRGKTHNWSKQKSLEEILVEDSYYQSDRLRKRLLGAGLLEKKCSSCGLAEWMGQDIPLELEHINGVHSDNRIGNLTILCPNCHALTSTYRGRNKKTT